MFFADTTGWQPRSTLSGLLAFRVSGFLLFKSVEIRSIRVIRVLFLFTSNFYMHPFGGKTLQLFTNDVRMNYRSDSSPLFSLITRITVLYMGGLSVLENPDVFHSENAILFMEMITV